MRLMVEFASPQVMQAAWRRSAFIPDWSPMIHGCRMPAGVAREFAAHLQGLGLDTHVIADGILVTAGTCDVDAAWRRARPSGRAKGETRFAGSACMLAHQRDALARGRAAYAKGRRAREVEQVEESGLADFMP